MVTLPMRGLVDLVVVSAAAVVGLGSARAQQIPTVIGATPLRRAGVLVIDGVNVIDVQTGTIQSSQRVVVRGARIAAVGQASRLKVPAGAHVVDGRGKYLIPGLWDMHVHADGLVNPYLPFLAYGVTGVREMGTLVPLDTIHRWRREIAAGERIGAHIIASGPYLEGDTNFGYGVAARTPAEARHTVDSLKAAGADFIKVHFNVAVSREVFFAIAAEARRVGIPIVGHQPPDVSLADASDSGQRTFEHVAFFRSPCWKSDGNSRQQCASEAAHLVRNHTWISPTLGNLTPDSVAPPRGWLAKHVPDSTSEFHGYRDGLWFVHEMHRMGVGFLTASDAIVGFQVQLPPGAANSLMDEDRLARTVQNVMQRVGGVHRELGLLIEAGFTPLEALQAATLNPAKCLGATDSLGTITPKKVADLVLLDANPLADITNTTKIRAVVANGRYFDRAALDSITAQVERGIRGQGR